MIRRKATENKYSVQVEAILKISGVYEIAARSEEEAKSHAAKALKNGSELRLTKASDYMYEVTEISTTVDK
jgi:hypothetical protein